MLDCLSHLLNVDADIYLVNFCTNPEKVVEITIKLGKQIFVSSGCLLLQIAALAPAIMLRLVL